MPFLNALNDFYLKNLSDRIKSVFQAKAKAGHKLTGTPPYGYMRSPEDKTRLVIDGYAANVVKRIFEMAYSYAARHVERRVLYRAYQFVQGIENLLQKLAVDYAVETADSNKRLQSLKLELHQLDIKTEQSRSVVAKEQEVRIFYKFVGVI